MELTWEGDCAFTMTGLNESGKPKALALQGLRGLRPHASEEEIDEAFQSAVVEAWRDAKPRRLSRLSELTASYEDHLSGKPRHLHERRTGGKKKPRCRLQKLHGLLQSLPFQQRRQTLLALSETQRRALEGWILSKHRVPNRQRRIASHFAVPRLPRAAQIWRCGAGFVAAVHLGRGLHAQSGKCQDLPSAARHFSALLRWRAKCQCLHLELCKPSSHCDAKEAELFARSVLEAQPTKGTGATGAKLFLRVRMNISGQRLSTPLRADVSMVLLEWLQLGCHQGESLHPGRRPETAASRWLQTCNAWREIWKKRGRAPESMQKHLAKAQKRFHCALHGSLQRRQKELQQLLQEKAPTERLEK